MSVSPAPDRQTFDLRGAHYHLGYVQGARTERFAAPPWWPAPPDLAFAEACAAQVAALHPPLLDELRGYADAQALPYADLLRAVCRRSMRARPPTTPARYPEGGCSSFARQDPDGHVRVGRNYDFHPAQRVRQRLRLRPDRGRPTLGTRGSVPGGRYDGVNDAGLFVSLHVALSDEPADPRPGIPFHWLPRLVLETCAAAAEAVETLMRVRHLHAFNYLVADLAGAMAVVEAHPERARVVEPERDAAGRPFIAATNHYRHPDMTVFQRGRRLAHSEGRLAHLYACGRSEAPEQLLASHAARLCGHSGGHITLWSLTADLHARRIAYTGGAPCENVFEPVPWPC